MAQTRQRQAVAGPGARDEAVGRGTHAYDSPAERLLPRRNASPPEPPEGWPEALGEAAYHGLAGEVVRTLAPHTEADPAALLVQLLVGVGSCIGRSPYYRVEGDRHAPNLYAVLVGETAKARKGTSWGRIRELLALADRDWARECIRSGLSSGEGLIWAVRDPTDKDPGIEDKRLYVAESEFAGVLRVIGRDGNTLSVIIRDAWDGGRLASLTKAADNVATNAHIAIVGHITSDELRRYLDRTESANGFANRFLFVAVRRSHYLPHGGALAEGALQPLAERIAETIEHARGLQRLVMEPAAARLWEQEYPALSEGQPGLLGAITARAEAQVIRLALVYALLDREPRIGWAHLEAGLAVWDYAAASARYVFGDLTGDPIADRILQALRSAPAGLSRTGISSVLGRHASATRIDHALATLSGARRVTSVTLRTDGRPTEVWRAC